jgi:hypothetical protein
MRLAIRREPFDDPDYLYELKYDGFRALACIAGGQAQLNLAARTSSTKASRRSAASSPELSPAARSGSRSTSRQTVTPQQKPLVLSVRAAVHGNPQVRHVRLAQVLGPCA